MGGRRGRCAHKSEVCSACIMASVSVCGCGGGGGSGTAICASMRCKDIACVGMHACVWTRSVLARESTSCETLQRTHASHGSHMHAR